MGSPRDHLPRLIDRINVQALLKDLELPEATRVIPMKDSSASFHVIYALRFDRTALATCLSTANIDIETCHSSDLILRISGDHMSKIKTENEVAILSWLNSSTEIPVPSVIAFDSSVNNVLGYEYIVMTRARGRCMAEVYPHLSQEQVGSFIDQIVDLQAQLHAHEWQHIGGLHLSEGSISPGPLIAEDQWFTPEISEYFPGETFESVNSLGPFDEYVKSIVADLETYLHIVDIHDSLAWMRNTVPLLRSFIKTIQQSSHDLNNTKICLAHKDLHFGNIMVDPDTARVTAILDWELSGPVPLPRWDPHRAFLWNTKHDVSSKIEQNKLVQQFSQRAEEMGYKRMLDDTRYSSPLQEQMQIVRDYCRAIVEVCPRGQRQELVLDWRKAMLSALKAFGIE